VLVRLSICNQILYRTTLITTKIHLELHTDLHKTVPTTWPKYPTKRKYTITKNCTTKLYEKIAQGTSHDHRNDGQHQSSIPTTSATPTITKFPNTHQSSRKWTRPGSRASPRTVTSRIPIAPRSVQHQRERLALGTLWSLRADGERVDYWREPTIACEIWCVRECG